jgi:hypothetical protein
VLATFGLSSGLLMLALFRPPASAEVATTPAGTVPAGAPAA